MTDEKRCICDDCKHAHSYSVKIGDCAYGNYADEFECDIEDWTEEDNILIDQNRCRHYEQMEESE